ncbi:P-loop containing nucleoside triphosphate hydrolase protein [Aspergillus taichungensis]|uniref:P-loop containing nucleoside triphosphate hydrolase protein n=1 Tax=Aspergillus taichungensis TaxID=482145 RepID=A0A2J5HMC6_9EURO|nr:P-loop containing nucleoside triphosphate hydrolase protein [Aspergillus taichungensis]
MPPLDARSERLVQFYRAVLDGKREIRSVNDFKRFLEGLFHHDDPSKTIERLVASPKALDALRYGLRLDITPSFINQYTAKFVRYLDDPKVKLLCNGQYLEQILIVIAETRTVWLAFLDALSQRKLDQDGILALAWLTTELLSLPRSSGVDVMDDAQSIVDDQEIHMSSSSELRNLAHKIRYLLQMKSSATTTAQPEGSSAAGGRHDNDFPDFRRTAILPTADEFACAERPFYRRAEEILELVGDQRVAGHLDNQFRLMREDMLSELRESVQIAQGKKKGRRPTRRLGNLALDSASCRDTGKRHLKPCAVGVTWRTGEEKIRGMTSKDRKAHLQKNPQTLRHNAFGCLLRADEIVAFATIERDIESLALETPVLKLRVSGQDALKKCLLYLKMYNDVEFFLVDASVFAYEPILKRLQDMAILPLKEELFLYEDGNPVGRSGLVPDNFVSRLEGEVNSDISGPLGIDKPVRIDWSQFQSLITGLTQSVSLIQGPPGTGKSFIGALLAKAFHDQTKEKILVMCYTNHALDQFLEDLLDIGIKHSSIVRIGPKSTPRTQPLLLNEQSANFKRSNATWNKIKTTENDARELESDLITSCARYKEVGVNAVSILEYLEFEDEEFFEALSVPEDADGMTIAGKNGQAIKKDHLYRQWLNGQGPGFFKNLIPSSCRAVWQLDLPARQEKNSMWIRALLEEKASTLGAHASQFNRSQKMLDTLWRDKTRHILENKRIIGCTTTKAAMFFDEIRQAAPGIILLEEAGEILESHVLAAMNESTKQLVMIGDHLQLRPKVNSYALTREKGEGYELNVSLFERLIHAGYPHTRLQKQHRMCPEISTLVRGLMYSDLEDGEKTRDRPPPRGLQDRVIFIQHEQPEVNRNDVSEKKDEGSTQSKSNRFEASLVLKIVKYLGQQGYGTDRVVVLTPYLGQLHLLKGELSKQNDPVLNDLDSHDLVRAGLISQTSANQGKRPIKLSTIDNYQGEESDIVIASLTRSNKQGDIGFMAAPERINVLLSRARDVLIMIGNSGTFLSSRQGKKCWKLLLDQLKTNGHIYDGLPVRCEQHPQTTAVLKNTKDFDRECPDGGCSKPCGAKLNCGIHDCPSKCHQLSDHSKMDCPTMVEWNCSRGHSRTAPCSKTSSACGRCLNEDKEQQRRRQRDLQLDADRQRKQNEYAEQLAEAQSEIAHLKRTQRDAWEDAERQNVLRQHQQEIENLKSGKTRNVPQQLISPTRTTNQVTVTNAGAQFTPPATPESTPDQPGIDKQEDSSEPPEPETSSPSENDWDYQKHFMNARSEEIDKLMGMIGLESVKEKFLAIKAKVDIAVSQNVKLDRERFGTVLLGNPGTGKTTVARLYAKFLASMGVLPGTEFVETTGSRLANDGVSGCKKILDKILEDGGGAMFIDEAYQLTQSSFGGTQVLDFLLAEVENLTGKMVFILAGYQRPMEKFFAHNVGLPSRFPHELKFHDYDDSELLRILERGIQSRWSQQMKVEGGLGGLYCRIVSRRVGRGRGTEGFGNARAIENVISKIADRQADRLKKARRGSKSLVDNLLLTREDLIGQEPAQALEGSKAWKKLKAMIGLEAVKESINALLGTIGWNYKRELSEKHPIEYSLNKVFLGSPGTGKTTVAKLYGQILVDLGLLSNGEVVIKNPSDLIGSALGESEKNTKGILSSTAGKVLVIDEAYGLFAGGTSTEGTSQSDPYRAAVVDTIVAEVQSTPGEDRCVLLLGYKDQMHQMFQNVNPGLSRRFPMDQAFVFEDFTKEQMDSILTLKLKGLDLGITERGRAVALEMIERARNRLNFGNAGEIDILLNSAKMRLQKRISSLLGADYEPASVFDAPDFDEDYDRADRGANVADMFEGVVGAEDIISKLEAYQQLVKRLRALNMEVGEEVPYNFLFRGPPGTGKTSTARKMGQVYFDMGLLASTEVVEASATDLVGQYVGQTGPKTHKMLENALGKVLFIDEAYRLAEGAFAKEAMDELVDCITKPMFFHKLIIVLAGYDNEINDLMSINPGLTSRFPESIQFHPLSPKHCIQLLTTLLSKRQKSVSGKGNGDVGFDLGPLERSQETFITTATQHFETLSHTAGWANARDVETIAKSIFRKALQTSGGTALVVTESHVLEALSDMVNDRASREKPLSKRLSLCQDDTETAQPAPLSQISHRPKVNTSTVQSPSPEKIEAPEEHGEATQPQSTEAEPRDPGVSDETWYQLQQAKAAAVALAQEDAKQQEAEAKEREVLREMKEQVIAPPTAPDDEAKRRHEQARLQRLAQLREQEELLEKLAKEKAAREERQRQEEKAQRKLREMGICPAGYRWVKIDSGYRCSAGGHVVSDAQLA